MENPTTAQAFDYRSLLSRYMQVVTNTEGVHFIDECSTNPDQEYPSFSQEEVNELYRLFDEFK